MASLRERDRGLAAQAERALQPWLRERVFRRQAVPWHDTSQGLRARLALLWDNPHLEEDVRSVREALGLPDDQLHARPGDEVWEDVEDFTKKYGEWPRRETFQQVADSNLGSWWLAIHRHLPLEKDPLLPLDALRTARESASVDLASANPEWLRRTPEIGVGISPMDRAVGRLMERHSLPATAGLGHALPLYVLTLDKSWIAGHSFPLTLVGLGALGIDPYESFSVSVGGLDEFVTEEDWAAVWRQDVAPRLSTLLMARGSKRFSRRGIDLERFKSTGAIAVYCVMVRERLGLEKAVARLRDSGQDIPADVSTLSHYIHDLKRLWEPLP